MVDGAWIVDASPLIVLARVGRLDLLGSRVVVPLAVALEVGAGPVDDKARRALEAAAYGTFPHVDVPPIVLEWGLGAGESAVLALALTDPASAAVLDDAQGRRCARALGVQVVGTLGVVVSAVRRRQLPAASPLLREMIAAGFRVDEQLVADVLLRALSETWSR